MEESDEYIQTPQYFRCCGIEGETSKLYTNALMSTIDGENKDEDGFLHITFSGEGRVCGSNEEQECSVSMI
ncbi:unnamed protein product [Prunus armeniaca]|uniref:Uncharacterized protein n=1 Tax=Prunus armeniaca TaxID=36596 RepID=A0A6J5Y785_PRUAR|nr:unnamed protein product [Prunus armeniaca]CAB4319384.1 unnamed protein product [Prunus armeniaca]